MSVTIDPGAKTALRAFVPLFALYFILVALFGDDLERLVTSERAERQFWFLPVVCAITVFGFMVAAILLDYLISSFDKQLQQSRSVAPVSVPVHRPSDRALIVMVPPAMLRRGSRVTRLNRGEASPADFTKAGRAIAWDILNLTNVQEIIFNPNLCVLFKKPPTKRDLHVAYTALADALWVQEGIRLRFQLAPSEVAR